MIYTINVDKTIQLNEIYFESNRFVDFIFAVMAYLIIPALPILTILYYIVHRDTFEENLIISLIIIAISLLIATIALFQRITRKRLLRLSGYSKELVLATVKELNWQISSSKQNYLIIKPEKLWRQISIIFDNNDILIHSARLTKYDIYFREIFQLDTFLKKLNEIKEKTPPNMRS
jgi:hypothetical protein